MAMTCGAGKEKPLTTKFAKTCRKGGEAGFRGFF